MSILGRSTCLVFLSKSTFSIHIYCYQIDFLSITNLGICGRLFQNWGEHSTWATPTVHVPTNTMFKIEKRVVSVHSRVVNDACLLCIKIYNDQFSIMSFQAFLKVLHI